jgi:hypothetical protein
MDGYKGTMVQKRNLFLVHCFRNNGICFRYGIDEQVMSVHCAPYLQVAYRNNAISW